jgi:cytoplasmic iron level regulating protein YaaA (DUF328/UPF0246 family)
MTVANQTMFLLPPSETKNDARGKAKLNLKTLSFPDLTKVRSELLNSLIEFSANSPARVRTALSLSLKQDFERERNTKLKTAPAAAAWKIYSGVLYEALNADALSAAALKKLTSQVYVQSALFGLISLGDLIPAYRLSADSKLPKIGNISNLWAKECSAIFENVNGLIVDMRSGHYANIAPIPKTVSEQVVIPKILQKMPSGPPKVVSHHNKATKGRIIRQVVTQAKLPTNAEQLAKVIAKLGADVELVKPKRVGQPITLNVVVAAL